MAGRLLGATAVALFLGFISGAGAADRPLKAPRVIAAYDWTGFYLGANAGYGTTADPVDHAFTPASDGGYQFAIAPQGWFAGGQLGYNWQTGSLVLGVEADAQGGSASQSICYDFCGVLTYELSQKQSWYATARGRVGWAFGPVLLYGTGGAAFTTFKTTITEINGQTVIGEFRDMRAGWTVGGGAEAALSGPWTAKVEYLYMDFGTISHSIPDAFLGPDFPNLYSIGLREHVVRAGLNYRFGAPDAPLASAAESFASAGSVGGWTGFYVGGNLGYARQRSPYEESNSYRGMVNQFVFVPGSVAGGVQAGGTWQFDRVALGVEADYQAMRQEQSDCGGWCLPTQSIDISEKSTWFATVRGRAGVVSGPAWYYVTGGVAFTKVNTDYRSFDGVIFAQGSFGDARTGWTVGGGIEAMLSPNWSAKAEYLYMDFGTISHTMYFNDPFGAGLASNSFSIDVREHVFRFGVNYHLGSI